jgi:hypothetical protein
MSSKPDITPISLDKMSTKHDMTSKKPDIMSTEHDTLASKRGFFPWGVAEDGLSGPKDSRTLHVMGVFHGNEVKEALKSEEGGGGEAHKGYSRARFF